MEFPSRSSQRIRLPSAKVITSSAQVFCTKKKTTKRSIRVQCYHLTNPTDFFGHASVLPLTIYRESKTFNINLNCSLPFHLFTIAHWSFILQTSTIKSSHKLTLKKIIRTPMVRFTIYRSISLVVKFYWYPYTIKSKLVRGSDRFWKWRQFQRLRAPAWAVRAGCWREPLGISTGSCRGAAAVTALPACE